MVAITVRSVTKTFGSDPVLRDINIDIVNGEFLTLLGPSGCGKSTLLKILAGLETQTSGSILFDQNNVDEVRPRDRGIAMVFQSYALYPHMTARENMSLPLRMSLQSYVQRLPLIGAWMPGARANAEIITKRVAEVANALEIGGLLDRKPGQFSGGQKQRVAVGRAIVREPKAFLMDEPLSNLDAKLRVQMRAEIKALHRRLGITFIYVTHDQSEAMTMSDRVAVMMDGRIVQLATPDAIYADPADERVAAFIGSPPINLFDASSDRNGRVSLFGKVIDAHIPGAEGRRIMLGIRPENLQIATQAGSNSLDGTVEDIESLGSDVLVHVALSATGQRFVCRCDPAERTGLAVGQTIACAPKPNSVLAFDGDGGRLPIQAAEEQPLEVVYGR